MNTMFFCILSRFRSQLETSYMSRHTEELSYNETVSLWVTIYIYIYIYIYVCVCVCVCVCVSVCVCMCVFVWVCLSVGG